MPDLLVLRLEAPLLYVNASVVRKRIKALVGAADQTPRAVILDLAANGDRLDITGSETLSALVRELHSARVDVALAEIRLPVVQMAQRSGLLETLGENRVYHTIQEAVHALDASRSVGTHPPLPPGTSSG